MLGNGPASDEELRKIELFFIIFCLLSFLKHFFSSEEEIAERLKGTDINVCRGVKEKKRRGEAGEYKQL